MNRYLNYKPISKSDDDDLHAARLEPEPSLENAVELNGGWPSFQPRGDWATKWFRPGSLIIASTLLGIFIGVSCYFLGKHVQQLETDTGLSVCLHFLTCRSVALPVRARNALTILSQS